MLFFGMFFPLFINPFYFGDQNDQTQAFDILIRRNNELSKCIQNYCSTIKYSLLDCINKMNQRLFQSSCISLRSCENVLSDIF